MQKMIEMEVIDSEDEPERLEEGDDLFIARPNPLEPQPKKRRAKEPVPPIVARKDDTSKSPQVSTMKKDKKQQEATALEIVFPVRFKNTSFSRKRGQPPNKSPQQKPLTKSASANILENKDFRE